MLRELRRIVKTCAPKATERLSYKMPYYEFHGRLVYFAAHTHHVSLYVWGGAMKKYAKEVEAYRTSSATLQFPIGSRVPIALVRKLIKARLEANLAAHKK